MIDAHIHIYGAFDATRLIDYMDRNGIEACWLLSWEESRPVPWPYRHLSIEALWEAYQQYPERIIPMYAPDPFAVDCLERFEQYYQLGIRGCAELKTALRWDDDRLQPLLQRVNHYRLPLTMHMEEGRNAVHFKNGAGFERFLERCWNSEKWGGAASQVLDVATKLFAPLRGLKQRGQYEFPGYMLDFAALEQALQRYPQIAFVGHGPYFWKCISATVHRQTYPKQPVAQAGIIVRLLEIYDNLYADLSGHSGINALRRSPAFSKNFLEKFSGKLLYGSDNYFAGQKAFLDGLKLSEKAYRRIYFENARRLTEQS